jgi:hypothetical protein
MKLAFAWKLPEGNLAVRSDDYRTSRPVTARPMIMYPTWQEPMIIDGYLQPFSRLSRNSDGTDA